MKYQILITKSAEKEMDKLSPDIHRAITLKILALEQNPRPAGIKKLVHREEYRLRSGSYRILYIIDDFHKTATIVSVAHRKEVYR